MTQRRRGLFHLTLPDPNLLLREVRARIKDRNLKARVFAIPCRITSDQGMRSLLSVGSIKERMEILGSWTTYCQRGREENKEKS